MQSHTPEVEEEEQEEAEWGRKKTETHKNIREAILVFAAFDYG